MADLNEIIGAIGAGIASAGITMAQPPAQGAPIITPGQPVPFDPRQLGFIFP